MRSWPFILSSILFTGLLFEMVLNRSGYNGISLTVTQCLLSGMILFILIKNRAKFPIFILLIPLGLLLSDLIYGFSTYVSEAHFANKILSLFYVVPFLVALIAANAIGLKWIHKFGARTHFYAICTLSFLFISLNTKLIVVPALFFKTPPLQPVLQWLTIVYTVIEGLFAGIMVTALIFARNKNVQKICYGLLLLAICDTAFRYQSVDLSLIGESYFEYAWAIGLFFVAIGIHFISVQNESVRTLLVLSAVNSYRAVITFSVFLSLLSGWVLYGFASGAIDHASATAASLLAVSIIFSIALFIANSMDERVNKFMKNSSSSDLPEELAFAQKVLEEARLNHRNEVNKIEMKLKDFSHDLKGPVSALKIAFDHLRGSRGVNTADENDAEIDHMVSASIKRIVDINKSILKGHKVASIDRSVLDVVDECVAIAKAEKTDIRVNQFGLADWTSASFPGLSEVLLNLVMNACEAAGEKGLVEISAFRSSEGIRIEIFNSGKPVRPDIVSAARSGVSITTKTNGNGIGLRTAFSWSHEHGHTLDVSPVMTSDLVGTLATVELRYDPA